MKQKNEYFLVSFINNWIGELIFHILDVISIHILCPSINLCSLYITNIKFLIFHICVEFIISVHKIEARSGNTHPVLELTIGEHVQMKHFTLLSNWMTV